MRGGWAPQTTGNRLDVSPMKQQATGIEYWRSLEQLADTPEVREMISQEFPGYDADAIATSSRRSFLKLMGASLALAGIGLNGCRRIPESKLAPYAASPRDRIPGIPEQYATSWEIGGIATGLLVTSYDGRPIKVEGNPTHPFSFTVKDRIGAADGFAQASVLDLYDPARSRQVRDQSTGHPLPASWDDFAAQSKGVFAALKAAGGNGLAILAEPLSGPTFADAKAKLLAAYPGAKWYEYQPLTRDAEIEGTRLAVGKAVRSVLHLDKAAVIVLLDADLFGNHPGHIRYASDWSTRRRTADAKGADRAMSRVYAAESAFTITGSVADHRLPVEPHLIDAVAKAIASRLGVTDGVADEKLPPNCVKFIEAAVADLKKAGKSAVVAAGDAASPAVHALALAINQKIGAIGETVTLYADPAAERPTHFKAIQALRDDLNAGTVNTLVVLGGNPAFDAPADLDFIRAMTKATNTYRLGLYEDETSAYCKWHLPQAHYLESWGDARAIDGTASIVQPLIEPLFGGKSASEFLAMISGDTVTTGEQLVRRTWKKLIKSGDFDLEYRRVLENGFLPNSGFEAVQPEPAKLASLPAAVAKADGLFLRFEPDSRVYDGRFANNGWLQETPDPLSKLVWDNAAFVSKKDADALGVTTNDLVHIEAGGRALDVAVYVLPGQPIGVVTLTLGYGRDKAGPIGDDLGFRTFSLRTSKTPYVVAGASVKKTSATYSLVSTSNHYIMDELGANQRQRRIGEKGHSGAIIREGTLAEYAADPRFAQKTEGEGHRTVALELFEPPSQFNTPHAWGMSVDLSTCIGCNACAVACQAENNIPVVGKKEATNHRQMNWIRIDRYFKGPVEDADVEVVYQPVMCQHCESAPCEQVCPVAATVHDTEGLNTMVYNRCIGTRYCANNCSYKVRRFNYFDFHSKDPRQEIALPFQGIPDEQQRTQIDQIKRMVLNPEVTVRMRGVMEKCTYCVQRIHAATTGKRAAGQEIADGDIVTACQQACPTQAITFGNLNDGKAKVTELHKSPRAYSLLGELNTRPRTQYLAKLRNPAEEAMAQGDVVVDNA